MLLYSGAVFF